MPIEAVIADSTSRKLHFLFKTTTIENSMDARIVVTEYSAIIEINKKSDLLTIFFFLKNILNLTKFIPESVYTISEPGVKKKKDLYFFKRKSLAEFLNLTEQIRSESSFDSETKESTTIKG